ncbi:PREDICTED: solute carrier family 7 member 13 isoform X2 [Chinchilla lanigera]|uniref:solute carrier family 7 member 13 isoform X2 n=1 Tax=Chinchilla lanigera TaxID=34839 RepID=UPI00038EC497|nr:PREDICTED: solute carrier family 7 member 13 isoform X2 [Chinchilla lanigera]
MGKEEKIHLKRELGYFWGTNFLIINVIGAGIFVSPKGVLEHSCMNVGISLCIWGACAVLAITYTLCFAEIGITFPCSGAHYYFIKRCFGPVAAFLRLWTNLFTGAGIVASQALLLAEYSIQPFYPSCSIPKLPMKCVALAMLWVVGILNCRGVKEVTWLQTVSTVLKVSILSLISLSGVVMLVRGKQVNVERLQNAFDAEFPAASQIIEAVFQGYFAFSGGGCFTCVADAVAITWTDRVIPQLTWFIPFAISASLFSNLLINVLQTSRVLYIAGQQGQLPLLFNTLNIHSSPLIAVLLNITMGSIAIVITNLIELINYLYFVISIWTVLSMIGLLKLRYQEPNLHRPYQVFMPFIFITMAMTLSMVLIPLVKSPKMHYIYVLLFLLSGLLFYIPFTYLKLKLVCFEKMTCYLQLLLNICVPDKSDEQI